MVQNICDFETFQHAKKNIIKRISEYHQRKFFLFVFVFVCACGWRPSKHEGGPGGSGPPVGHSSGCSSSSEGDPDAPEELEEEELQLAESMSVGDSGSALQRLRSRKPSGGG